MRGFLFNLESRQTTFAFHVHFMWKTGSVVLNMHSKCNKFQNHLLLQMSLKWPDTRCVCILSNDLAKTPQHETAYSQNTIIKFNFVSIHWTLGGQIKRTRNFGNKFWSKVLSMFAQGLKYLLQLVSTQTWIVISKKAQNSVRNQSKPKQ